ncbi:Folliculin [Frankliniella fusca]|uniref:Folliculin n=1 Tax=Frankliniella fusca TaxID=407009 RepID=A0AAE1LSF9_9NEOP|nr:Folliculin [Frankliniella fusca]
MNAIISVCHFCELHGPSVLLSTQNTRCHNEANFKRNKFYGFPECLQSYGTAVTSSCEACQSIGNNIFVTSDHDTQTSYISTQLPWQSETEALVRQACTRSLSCEVSHGKEGVLVFSDDLGVGGAQGCSVLSHTFLIRDSLARGFHRWFSITVLTRDRLLLLNVWPFLEKNISVFVSEMQSAANKVYEAEQTARPQRALRLSNAYCVDKSSRALPEITGSPQVYAQLHLWFVWLLRNSTTHLRETFPPLNWTLPFGPLEDSEQGITFISAKRDLPCTLASPNNQNSVKCLVQTAGPSVNSLGMLRVLLGPANFACVVFCLLVGRQVVVRGQPAALVTSILLTLKVLLPKGCERLIPFSSQYVSPSECNMLGIEARAAVPQPSPQVARVEVLLPPDCETQESMALFNQASQFRYHLKWPGQLPTKWPTYLAKLDRAMESNLLSDSTLSLQIAALRMETLNAARVLHQVEFLDKKDSCDRKDKNALLQALGVNSSDLEVLSFWAKGCLSQL